MARLRGFPDVCRSFRSTVFDLFDKFDLISNDLNFLTVSITEKLDG